MRVCTKERITIRIDKDILNFFKGLTSKEKGRGYQTKINQALMEYIVNGPHTMDEVLRRVVKSEIAKIKRDV